MDCKGIVILFELSCYYSSIALDISPVLFPSYGVILSNEFHLMRVTPPTPQYCPCSRCTAISEGRCGCGCLLLVIGGGGLIAREPLQNIVQKSHDRNQSK